MDLAGIIPPSADADRAVRYLTKYLTKAIADVHRQTLSEHKADRAAVVCEALPSAGIVAPEIERWPQA